MTLTELAIKRPTLIVVIFSLLGVLGVYGYFQLNYELLPKISAPVITITTVYPGASPTEVENTVTRPIEDAISGLDNISMVRANSAEGVSLVFIEFKQSADVDISLQDAQRRVNQILSTLPDDVKSPMINKFALDEIPVLRMGVTSSMPSREFTQFLKDHVQPAISKVAGVGQVTMVGGVEREIRVSLDAQKLRAYGLSISQVVGVIRAANLDFPTGRVKETGTQYVVRIAGKIEHIDDLKNLVIKRSKQGGDIRVCDVAEVVDGSVDMATTSRINGVTSVALLVQKQTDANAVEVSKLVRQQLKKLETANANVALKFDVAQDASQFTVDAANSVKEDLALAVLLVALVMFLFLHSIRNSLIVMVAIPSSLVTAFLAMWLLGFTLNLMTLLALSLVIGILVDDSIVVLENIYHHIEKGEERRSAALRGRNEIGFAALSITLVDVVVFVPLAASSGMIGNILREFSLVVVISTLTSLFVSFTITPLLASRFSTLERLTNGTLMGRLAIGFERMFRRFTEKYLELLEWSLHHRARVFIAITAMFIASVSLVPLGYVGSEFMKQTDRGEFTVTIELPSGSTVETTNQIAQRIERTLAGIPEIRKVFTNVGVSSEGIIGQTANNSAEFNVALYPREMRARQTDEVGAAIKTEVQKIPGIKVRVNPVGIFGVANQTPVQIAVTGTDMAGIRRGADSVAAVLRRIPGTADVRLSSEVGKPETRVEIDRQKLSTLGLSIADVGTSLRVALTGDDQSKYREGDTQYDIRINLDELDRSRTDELSHLTFVNSRGEQVELSQFARVYQAVGPTKLERMDRNASMQVFAQVIGVPSGNIIQQFKPQIEKKLDAGVQLVYLGDEKNRADGFGTLGIALLAGILFVYLIMVALYDSYAHPFVVLFSIPLAMIGAILALALSNQSLSIFSILGIIMLIGLVSKNAILLVDRTNSNRAEGMAMHDALIEAGKSRIRPIFMTTLSMVFGMMPIALSKSSGAEFKAGLSWALIGGLTSSMFLTLVLVPVMYTVVDRWRDSVPARIHFILVKLRLREERIVDAVLPHAKGKPAVEVVER